MNLIFLKFIEVWPQWVACKVNEPLQGSFTLHATHCGHTSINLEKNKIHFLKNAPKYRSLWSRDHDDDDLVFYVPFNII